jgi:magnesium chelatase family protein
VTPTEAPDITRIYSVAGTAQRARDVPLIRYRPFRTPHHTISHAGFVGRGQWPQPGETRTCGGAGVSLAHRRMLFQSDTGC